MEDSEEKYALEEFLSALEDYYARGEALEKSLGVEKRVEIIKELDGLRYRLEMAKEECFLLGIDLEPHYNKFFANRS